MEQFMMLDQYLKMGGKIENLNLDNTISVFNDRGIINNYFKPVQAIDLGDLYGVDTDCEIQMYILTFTDGTSKEYFDHMIQTVVNMTLDQKYL